MRAFMGNVVVDKDRPKECNPEVITVDSVKQAIGRFYQLTGQAPSRILVRPGFEFSTEGTVRGLGLRTIKVAAGTRGILTGELWME